MNFTYSVMAYAEDISRRFCSRHCANPPKSVPEPSVLPTRQPRGQEPHQAAIEALQRSLMTVLSALDRIEQKVDALQNLATKSSAT